MQVVALEDVAAVAVDGLALAVQHVVVLQHVLADLGVARLDLATAPTAMARETSFDSMRDVVRDRAAHERLGGAGVEQAHQVVGERQVEAALARVALAAGAAAQLVVDAARLVALGAEHVQAADRRRPSSASSSTACLGRLEDGVPRGLVLLGGLVRVEALRRSARRRRGTRRCRRA